MWKYRHSFTPTAKWDNCYSCLVFCTGLRKLLMVPWIRFMSKFIFFIRVGNFLTHALAELTYLSVNSSSIIWTNKRTQPGVVGNPLLVHVCYSCFWISIWPKKEQFCERHAISRIVENKVPQFWRYWLPGVWVTLHKILIFVQLSICWRNKLWHLKASLPAFAERLVDTYPCSPFELVHILMISSNRCAWVRVSMLSCLSGSRDAQITNQIYSDKTDR